jgi:hypothetical protein
MNSPPRNLPRFLPTLTEVVDPSTVAHLETPVATDVEEAVGFVMQRVDILVERRLQEQADLWLREMIAEHLQSFVAGLRLELEAVVRQAVADAITTQAERHKAK